MPVLLRTQFCVGNTFRVLHRHDQELKHNVIETDITHFLQNKKASNTLVQESAQTALVSGNEKLAKNHFTV